MITKEIMSEQIFAAKKVKNFSFENISQQLGKGEVWVTSVCFGMNSMPKDMADKLCKILDLDDEVSVALQQYPHKSWSKKVPQDPVIYRFYELIGVYGDSIKAIIGEKFGDGIMSAIDFSMDIKKDENSKEDRVVITLNGKFLRSSSW